MEHNRRDDWIFDIPDNLDECQRSIEGLIDWFPVADEFPRLLWCIHYPDRGTYACRLIPEDPSAFGLVTFSTLDYCRKFINAAAKHGSVTDCISVLRTFDEARDLAKDRQRVRAVMLLDDPANPKLHYVRVADE